MTVDRLLSEPSGRGRLLDAVMASLRRGNRPDLLVSSGTGALVLTSLLAAELGLPMAYLRPKPKSHGRQKRLEGELRGAHPALVAVDPTVETVQDNAQLLAEGGLTIERLIAVANGALDAGLAGLHIPTDAFTPETLATAAHQPAVATRPAGSRPLGAGDVARVLLEAGAVTIRAEPFRYASGLLSPIYTDCRLLISHPHEWARVVAALTATAASTIGLDAFDAVDGVATSGIPHAAALARRLDKPLVYVDGGALTGAAPPGARLLIVEDLVTTGKSVLEAAAALRGHGLAPRLCLAIFTYNRQQPALATAGLDFEPLSDLDTLLDTGVAGGYFGPAERDAVLDWRRDPQAWTARHEPPG